MKEEDEMVRLLLSRGKMLNLHCPECSLPLFQKDKKIVCVRCGGVEVVEKASKGKKGGSLTGETRMMLEKKKRELLLRLDKEKDPKKIVSILEAVSKIDKEF